MYLSAVNLIILLNFIPQSNSNNVPLILFNNDENGINIEFLEKNKTIIAESTSKVYETDYKIISVDFNFNEKYLIWSCSIYSLTRLIATRRCRRNDLLSTGVAIIRTHKLRISEKRMEFYSDSFTLY